MPEGERMISAPWWLRWLPERSRQEQSIERQLNARARAANLPEYSDQPDLYKITGWGLNELRLCCNAKFEDDIVVEDFGKITA